MKFDLLSPAKINLFLSVGPKQITGFHYLASLFTTINIADEISIEFTDTPSFELETENNLSYGRDLFEAVTGPEHWQNNILYKTYQLLGQNSARPFGLRIRLSKKIPLGGGLGGGSSNAAQLFYAWWQSGLAKSSVPVADSQLGLEFAQQIGSDVPFFLWHHYSKKAALLLGQGAQLSPVDLKPIFGVLALPDVTIPTSEAFTALKRPLQRGAPPKYDFRSALGAGSFSVADKNHRQKLLAGLLNQTPDFENDFELFAFAEFPELQVIQQTFIQNGCYLSRLSGSGATIFGLCKSENEQSNLLTAMKEKTRDLKTGIQFLAFSSNIGL